MSSVNVDKSVINDTYIGISAAHATSNKDVFYNDNTDSHLYFENASNGLNVNIGKRFRIYDNLFFGLDTDYLLFKSFGAKPHESKSPSKAIQQSLNFPACVNTQALGVNFKPQYYIENSNVSLSAMIGAMHWIAKNKTYQNVNDDTEVGKQATSWGLSYGLELGYQLSNDIDLKLGVRQFKIDLPYDKDNVIDKDITSIYAGFNYAF